VKPHSNITWEDPGEPKIRADHLQRAEIGWRARVAGATWKQVAEVAGYASAPNALRGVRDGLGSIPQVDVQEMRVLWRDRLEVMWQQTLRDMREQKPGAVTAGVRVATAAAALDGLNAPTKVEVAVAEQFEMVVAELITHDLA